MGSPQGFPPELLLVGILSSPLEGDSDALCSELVAAFGPIGGRGPELPFPWSGYYDGEMGGRPRRGFLAFSRLVDPASLAEIKARTNAIEGFTAVAGSRRYNLDPGLLSPGRFVLATTKERPHRIPLGGGIYGELTLLFERGEYRPLPWTYPDWASPEYRSYLAQLRSELKPRLREFNREGGARA